MLALVQGSPSSAFQMGVQRLLVKSLHEEGEPGTEASLISSFTNFCDVLNVFLF